MRILVLSLLFLVSCGTNDEKNIQCVLKGCKKNNPTPLPEEAITSEQILALSTLKSNILKWAPTCGGGIACTDDSDGDSMLWAGLLCSSGETKQCTAVKNSHSASGRPWRSPSRVDIEVVNSSSRDMLLGDLSYIVSSKDTTTASNLVNYIKTNNYKLCPSDSDDRCNIDRVRHSALWGTMKRIWQYIGLNPTTEMEQGDFGDETIIGLESKFSTQGFPRHLIAVEIKLRQSVHSFSDELQEAANRLLAFQPDNPFFEYVARGKTSRAADLVLQKCPVNQPSRMNQWAWQRDESEQAWLHSMGWDCIYLVDLLTE